MENKTKDVKKSIQVVFRRPDVGISIVAILFFMAFTLASESFCTAYNIHNLLRTAGLYMFMGLAQSCVVIINGMNLAVGSVGGFCGMFVGIALEWLGLPIFMAIIIALGVGCLCGLLHGIMVNVLQLTAFVITLSMQFIYIGLTMGITKGIAFVDLPSSITLVGQNSIGGVIPYILIVAIIVLIVMGYFLKYTVTGRHLLATGGNEEAARISGINVK